MVDLPNLAALYLFAHYVESDQLLYRKARKVELRSEPPLMFSLDGDMIDEQPVSFRCLPNALNVIAGPEYDMP